MLPSLRRRTSKALWAGGRRRGRWSASGLTNAKASLRSGRPTMTDTRRIQAAVVDGAGQAAYQSMTCLRANQRADDGSRLTCTCTAAPVSLASRPLLGCASELTLCLVSLPRSTEQRSLFFLRRRNTPGQS